jgi:hypothetical protein
LNEVGEEFISFCKWKSYSLFKGLPFECLEVILGISGDILSTVGITKWYLYSRGEAALFR